MRLLGGSSRESEGGGSIVKSTKPPEQRRRSGSGRAKSPEAEARRREAIRKAALERKKMDRVVITAGYRKPGRTKGANGHTLPQRAGYNYEFRDYATRIPAGIATNPRKLNEHLDRLHPRRAHFHARVVEYR